MRIYQGGDLPGVSIVDYGLTLTVADGKATVEYNGVVGDFHETLRNGHIAGRVDAIALCQEQLAWLRDNKTWIKTQIEDGQ